MIFNKVKNENNAKVDCGIERVNKQTKKRNFRKREKLRKFALLSHHYVHSCDIRKISSVMQLSVCRKHNRVSNFGLPKSFHPNALLFLSIASRIDVMKIFLFAMPNQIITPTSLTSYRILPITLKSARLGTSPSFQFVNGNVFSCRQTIRIVLLPSTSKK